jgi:small nuclear ribonucleoprotein (snRNP)-like protein
MDNPKLSLSTNFINGSDKEQKQILQNPSHKKNPKKNKTSEPKTSTVLHINQNDFLQHILNEKKKILLQLTNMQKLIGYLLGYDNFSVTFVDISSEENKDTNASPIIIFKHSILSMKEFN